MSQLAVLAAALVLFTAAPSRATFHLARINEAMSGVGGNTNVQFVEIVMNSILQTSVANSRLTWFNCDFTQCKVLMLVPINVANSGTGLTWLMASPSDATFFAATGVHAEFYWDNSLAGSIDPTCGMICWGAPGISVPAPTWDPGEPNNYVDCVAYGGYTGRVKTVPGASGATSGNPTNLTAGDGMTKSLTRVNQTNDNLTDFALATKSPTSNGPGNVPTQTTPPAGSCTPVTETTTTTTSTTTTTIPSTGPSKCTGKEFAAAGKKAGKKAKCEAKVIAKNDTSSLSACNSAAETKFGTAFGKAAAKMDCINPAATAGDVETTVDNFVSSLTSQLAGASTGPSKCTSKELSAAGKLANSEAGCHGKSIGKGDPTTVAGCVSTAKAKFEAAYGKAMDKMDCINPAVTAADVEGTVDGFITNLNGQLAP